MMQAPKGIRLHISVFGRTNVGKSCFVNLVVGQKVSITSCHPGTTTDVVDKVMELLPLGPVVFHDTAGLDDRSLLGAKRVDATKRVLNRTDVALLVLEPDRMSQEEEVFAALVAKRSIPIIAVVNKADLSVPRASFLKRVHDLTPHVFVCSSVSSVNRDAVLAKLKAALISVCPERFIAPPPLVGDLVPPGGQIVLIVPIDLEAPKGRLILPQVQTIRDALDHGLATVVIKDDAIGATLERFSALPDLAVCDSQVVDTMVSELPLAVPCTTFSILFARLKGDLGVFAEGAEAIDTLRDGDRVLIAESCSHHPVEDDIGRVKIPRWLREYTGARLEFNIYAGHDFPSDLSSYRLVVQCGGCVHNRREMLTRIENAQAAGVAITNYGICISKTHRVLERVLSPFRLASRQYDIAAMKNRNGMPRALRKEENSYDNVHTHYDTSVLVTDTARPD